MCASCVAQGVAYVGGSVGLLRVMAHRAATRRAREGGAAVTPDAHEAGAMGSGLAPSGSGRGAGVAP